MSASAAGRIRTGSSTARESLPQIRLDLFPRTPFVRRSFVLREALRQDLAVPRRDRHLILTDTGRLR